MKFKIISLGALFLAFFGLLIVQGFNDGTSSVYLPSELMAKTQEMKRVRVAGRVAEGDVNYQVQPLFKLDFQIKDPDGKSAVILPVSYAGIKPDMFAVGRDVIIDGQYVNGVLIAQQLLTQCPSKYEPPKPKEAGTATSSPLTQAQQY